jgi:hypothetical protein
LNRDRNRGGVPGESSSVSQGDLNQLAAHALEERFYLPVFTFADACLKRKLLPTDWVCQIQL